MTKDEVIALLKESLNLITKVDPYGSGVDIIIRIGDEDICSVNIDLRDVSNKYEY